MTMARLYRFVKLQDRFDTEVFTFILPGSLGQDSAHRDVESKDFNYGHHKWHITVTRNEANIGTFLTLKNVTDGLSCMVDFSFTFTNKEHFTKNDTYTERNCKFSSEKFKHGRKNFVSAHDLAGRGYVQENGNYLLNLEIRNITTMFDQVVQLPSETSKGLQIGSANRHQKFETGYFSFGNFDWNLVLFPFGDSPERDGRPLLYMVRQTGLDHHCRVKFKVTLGQGDRTLMSDVIEQLLDTSGQGPPYDIGCNLYTLTASKNKLHIKLELLSSTAISECHLFPLNRNKNKSHLYDRDKQAWLLESDSSVTHLKFRLFYTDARNVPRRHMRYTCWGLSVVPRRGHYKPIPAVGVPYSHYYTQMDVDVEGYDIPTDITVKEISNPASAILDRESRMTVQVEWINSHLLYDDLYNRLDEVDSRHKYQMAREIMALQAENLSLEKQLHSYQVSIARNNSKGQLEIPKDMSVPSSPDKSKRSSEHRSSRRDRSRDRRKKEDPYVNNSDYHYSDRVSEGYPTDSYKRGGGTVDKYKTNTDGYNGKHDGDIYPDDPYGEDYQYYSDKYSSQYADTEQYYDKSDKYYDYSDYPICDTYTADQYHDNKYPDTRQYSPPDTRSYSPEKLPESVPYPYAETYTEEYIRQRVERRPSQRSNENGATRGRDIAQPDDGYFSSQSTQLQAELLAQQQQTGPALVNQYLETYPEERTERSPSSGRRSPSVRSKHGRKAAMENYTKEALPPAMSRDRPKSRRHRDK